MISGSIYYCYSCKDHFIRVNESNVFEDIVLMCNECCLIMCRKIINDNFIKEIFKVDAGINENRL